MVIEYGSLVSFIQIMHFLPYETNNDASTFNLLQQLAVFALHLVSWVPIQFASLLHTSSSISFFVYILTKI